MPYSGDPKTSPADYVRFLIQDTHATQPHLTDAEINFLISTEGPGYPAAVEACHALARKFASQPASKTIGDLSITYADLTTRYTTLGQRLQARAARSADVPIPSLGGLGAPRKFDDDDIQWANTNSGGEDSRDPLDRNGN